MGGSAADDLQNAVPAAKSMASLVHDLEKELGESDEAARKASRRAASGLVWLQGAVGSVIVFAVNFIEPFILFVLQALTNLRTDTTDAQAEISSGALSEFLGADISVKAPDLKGGKGAHTIEVSRSIGDALYTRLNAEFGVPSGEPGPGEKAARTFSGYGVNFATQNAIISTLADAISFHTLEEFRELGVGVARNLGLGRLQRLALGTLLTQAIQKPYTRELAAKLRPDRLTKEEYGRQYRRDAITREQFIAELQEAGYRDEDIEAVIADSYKGNSAGELEGLVRYGTLSNDIAQALLVQQGIPGDVAQRQLEYAWRTRTDNEVGAYAAELVSLYGTGQMDEDTFDKLLAPLPLTDDEKLYKKLLGGLKLEYREKLLTWAQVTTAFENGIVDVDYVEQWLISKGYTPDDQINMLLLLAVAVSNFETKAAAAAAKAAAKNPKKSPGQATS